MREIWGGGGTPVRQSARDRERGGTKAEKDKVMVLQKKGSEFVIFCRKPGTKRSLRRHKDRWGNNITIDLKEWCGRV